MFLGGSVLQVTTEQQYETGQIEQTTTTLVRVLRETRKSRVHVFPRVSHCFLFQKCFQFQKNKQYLGSSDELESESELESPSETDTTLTLRLPGFWLVFFPLFLPERLSLVRFRFYRKRVETKGTLLWCQCFHFPLCPSCHCCFGFVPQQLALGWTEPWQPSSDRSQSKHNKSSPGETFIHTLHVQVPPLV